MSRVTIVLVILMACLSETKDEIKRAKIYSRSNKDKLEFSCSIYGLKETSEKDRNFYIYLCRNGVGIAMQKSCQDATFYIDTTTKDNTGNYSCVFSEKEYNLQEVKETGINSIFIIVNDSDSFIPAEIALPQTSVKMGSDVEFQCTSIKLPERNQKGNIYAYLYRNGIVIQMTIWDTTKNESRFTLKEVTMQDAGTYICFLLSEPCPFPKRVHGVNELNLHITVPEYFHETRVLVIVGGLFLLMIITLSLGIWAMFHKKGCCKCTIERTAEYENEAADAEMNQETMQNEHSSGSEWDNSSDSACASCEGIYQVCEDP